MKKNLLVLFSFYTFINIAIAGTEGAGGSIQLPVVLGGDEFSFSCKVNIKTAHLTFTQDVELSNNKNEIKPRLKDEAGYYAAYDTKLSSEELEEQLSEIGGKAMLELQDAKIFVVETDSASRFDLHISGKMKDYEVMPYLSIRRSFSVDDEKIDSELVLSHAYKTEEYGLSISCVNNNR